MYSFFKFTHIKRIFFTNDVDEDEDHVVLPAHDTDETISALCCYSDPINYKPIRIFIQPLGAQTETPHKPRPTVYNCTVLVSFINPFTLFILNALN